MIKATMNLTVEFIGLFESEKIIEREKKKREKNRGGSSCRRVTGTLGPNGQLFVFDRIGKGSRHQRIGYRV